MSKDNIKCVCEQNYDCREFKKHFKECKSFLIKFDKFDFKIRMLLKEYIVDKEDINLVKFLLKTFYKYIDKIISINNQENPENIPIQKIEKDKKLKQDIMEEIKIKKDYYIKPNKNILYDDNIQNNNNNINQENNIINNSKNNINIYKNNNFNTIRIENCNRNNIFTNKEDKKSEYKQNNKIKNERNEFSLFENNEDNNNQKYLKFNKDKSVSPFKNNNICNNNYNNNYNHNYFNNYKNYHKKINYNKYNNYNKIYNKLDYFSEISQNNNKFNNYNNNYNNLDFYFSEINQNNNKFNRKGKYIKRSALERIDKYEVAQNNLKNPEEKFSYLTFFVLILLDFLICVI